jgi:hypothetical protein
VTLPLELIQGELESGLEEGPDDEAQEAYGRANHCHPERAQGRYEDRRPVSQARDQRCELLQLESKYGGLEVSEAKRLLESEKAKLKKLLADAMLDNAALKDLLAKKW